MWSQVTLLVSMVCSHIVPSSISCVLTHLQVTAQAYSLEFLNLFLGCQNRTCHPRFTSNTTPFMNSSPIPLSELIKSVYLHNFVQLVSGICLLGVIVSYLLINTYWSLPLDWPHVVREQADPSFLHIYFPFCQLTCLSFIIPGGWCFLGFLNHL